MNRLERIKEFQTVLSNYQISDATRTAIRQTPFIALVSVSSAGRNTMIRRLVEGGKYHFVVSDTTRRPRVNDGVLEQTGREYWFKSEDEFLEGLKKGDYIEAAIIHNQQVSGVSVKELNKAKQDNLIAISDIDVQGVEKMQSISELIIPVFVIPPSYKEWQDRLRNRGEMSEGELQNRLSSAEEELSFALSKDYYHFLINNDLEHAIKGLDKIAHDEIDLKHEAEGRQAAEQILKELRSGTQGT
jgi:guanylate kinase